MKKLLLLILIAGLWSCDQKTSTTESNTEGVSLSEAQLTQLGYNCIFFQL